MEQRTLQVGDVVQLDPEKHLAPNNGFFAGCFMVVTEPKSFVAQGYIAIPETRGAPPSMAYYRASWEEMEYIGHVEWLLQTKSEATASTSEHLTNESPSHESEDHQ